MIVINQFDNNQSNNPLYISSDDDDDNSECSPFKFTQYYDFTRDNEYVLSITFNLGYHGKIKETIHFDYTEQRTVNDAIGIVEDLLNTPVTDSQLTFLNEKKDLQDIDWDFQNPEDRAYFKSRGDCLGEKTIIYNIEFKPHNIQPYEVDSESDNITKTYYDIVLLLEA